MSKTTENLFHCKQISIPPFKQKHHTLIIQDGRHIIYVACFTSPWQALIWWRATRNEKTFSRCILKHIPSFLTRERTIGIKITNKKEDLEDPNSYEKFQDVWRLMNGNASDLYATRERERERERKRWKGKDGGKK